MVAIFASSFHEVRLNKLQTLGAVITGWAVLLLAFALFGDRLASVFGPWTRAWDYGAPHPGPESISWWWWRFRFVPISCVGFLASGWIVGRMNRGRGTSMALAYAASVLVALSLAAAIIASRGSTPTPVPHTLFYAIVLALPYYGRVGFVLVPTAILVGALLGSRRDETTHVPSPAASAR